MNTARTPKEKDLEKDMKECVAVYSDSEDTVSALSFWVKKSEP